VVDVVCRVCIMGSIVYNLILLLWIVILKVEMMKTTENQVNWSSVLYK
jgi:hypothetical protein